MGQHRLKLHIYKRIPNNPRILATKTLSMRERVLRLLFGKPSQVTLVVPGRSVNQIDITERNDDASMALADASLGGEKQ